ncbi:MAG: hypothetical protein ACTHL1_05750 [Burkholderiaceae bacterium]
MDRNWWIAAAGSIVVVGGSLLLLDWLVAQPPLRRPDVVPATIDASGRPTTVPPSTLLPSIEAPRMQVLPDGALRRCRDGGRTLYTDRPCPDGGIARAVALHDTAGFEPPRAPAIATFTAPDSPARPSAVMLETRPPRVADAMTCGALLRDVDYWDALARQPQSAATQDWIRERKRAAQAAQHEAGC